MEMRPLHDRVIIRRIEKSNQTASGIIIPDASAEKPSRGEVVATGKGKTTADGTVIPLDVKVGDQVVFTQYAGAEITIGDEKLLIMSESDIVAIIQD